MIIEFLFTDLSRQDLTIECLKNSSKNFIKPNLMSISNLERSIR